MAIFAIFANGAFWGNLEADDASSAIQLAASEWGTDGDTDGISAQEVTEKEASEIAAWWEAGAAADLFPLKG